MDMNNTDPFDRNKPYNQLPLLPQPDKVIDNDILLRWGYASRALAQLNRNILRLPNPNMLVNTITLQEAQSSSAIENKDDYYYNLGAVTQRKSWKNWIMYMLNAVEQTSKHTNQIIDEIIDQMKATLEYAREELRWYSKEINEALFTRPYVKPKIIGDISGKTSRTTLTKYMSDLTRLGILTPKQDGKEVYYINIDLVRILEG